MYNIIRTIFAVTVAAILASAKPENKAVKVGQNAELEYDFGAAPPSDRKWTKVATTPVDVAVEGTGTGNEKYDEAVNGQVSKLTIKNVEKDDGELYTCSASGHSASANLVILGTPVCTLAIEASDQIKFICEVDYGGNLEPKLNLVQSDTSLDSTGGSAAGGKISHNGDVAASGLDTKSFSCSVTFAGITLPTEPTGIDNTVPSYTETCDIQAEKPTSVDITPAGATFNEGDRLTCTATGKPTPSIQWSDGTNTLASSNGVLTLTTGMTGKTLTCSASNNIGTETATRDVTAVAATTAGPTTVSSQNSANCPRFHGLGIAAAFLSAILF